MKLKNIVMLVLALCMVFTLCACGQEAAKDAAANNTTAAPAATAPQETTAPAEELVKYTVTLVDTRGNAVAGAKVQLCDDENCFLPQSTDESGVVVFEQKAGDYKAKVTSMPVGYNVNQEYFYFADGATELTITVNIQTYTYVVKVMDQDGNPVADVDLKFVKSDSENIYTTTAEGKFEVTNIKTDYAVSVESAPDAYAPDATDYTFPAEPSADNIFELTITLKPAA